MRIVIDMQGAQTASRFRGIGRYTMEFARAVVRNRGEHEIFLVLSGLFPETIEPIRSAFNGLLPQENIRVWSAPGPVSELHPDNASRRQVAELLREAFIASLQPDLVHICSLFEGYVDDAVGSVGLFDKKTPVSVILYDLIPLLNPDQYLKPNPSYEQYYRRKIESLQRASLHLAISDFAKAEALQVFGTEAVETVAISTALDGNFKPLVIDADQKFRICQKFGITRPFVLYVGGFDERKNLPRLIKAYAALPEELRSAHQLVFAGKLIEGLNLSAQAVGLKSDEILFTGYISDEDLVQLYNLCQLYVFPSWHEGFGLPALEAMACGAPVIGANTSSLPEVIGLEEALFDPFDVKAMTEKLKQALQDEDFRNLLKEHGLKQSKKFDWNDTAKRAIIAWQGISKDRTELCNYADQSAAYDLLLTALAAPLHAATEPECIAVAHALAQNEGCGVKRQLLIDISELCQRDAATGVQRVVRSYLKCLLQFPPAGFRVEPVYATQGSGYSYARRFTQRLLGKDERLVEDTPMRGRRGDIFFGLDMQHHVQISHTSLYSQLMDEGVVVKFLVYDLLPIQLAELFKDSGAKELHEQLLAMIAGTDGAVCISKATADALDAWIYENDIHRSPTFRSSWVHIGADIDGSIPSSGLPEDADRLFQTMSARPTFLCVSTLEPRKCQGQILDAVELLWQRGIDANLVLVGQQGWKIDALAERLSKHPEAGTRLFWLKGISDEYLEKVYAASSCLIAASLNEGFGLSLIEAARHGIPIIARDIPIFREVAGNYATYFKGDAAEDLALALESWLGLYRVGEYPSSSGMPWLTWQESAEQLKSALIEHNYPRRQLLVDVSELVQRDARTGIQRVVRSVLIEWLRRPPEGYRVEPVYASVEHGYKYAKAFKSRFMGEPGQAHPDELIEYAPGDIFIGLDLNHHVPRVHQAWLQEMYACGVDVRFVVYDLLPIQFPEFWEGPHTFDVLVADWLKVVSSLGGAVCISKAVADEFAEWVEQNPPKRERPLAIDWFHLGADVENSHPTRGMPPNADVILAALDLRPTFVMVGTLEPRKGHLQVFDAFEKLWKDGSDVNLVIVGKQGWMVQQLVERLGKHAELSKRLFWLDAISDEYLDHVYANSDCLIAASYGEGFGLPLIEAAQHGLSIIARDIPVFREVAGEHAFYFATTAADELAESIVGWLELHQKELHPKSDAMPWMTWEGSAEQLLNVIVGKRI